MLTRVDCMGLRQVHIMYVVSSQMNAITNDHVRSTIRVAPNRLFISYFLTFEFEISVVIALATQ